MSDETPATRGAAGPSRRGPRENARLLVVITVSALVAVFAVLNTGSVEVNWIFGTFETPLIIVIVACIGVGLAFGYGLARLDARRRRRSAAR